MIKWLFRLELWQKGCSYLREKGFKKAFRRFISLTRERIWESCFLQVENEERYEQWWRSQELDSQAIGKMKQRLDKFKYKPVISVLVPVYNTPARWLEECFQSVEKQIYPYWELCVVDDASTSVETREVLNRWKEKSKEDKRIKILRQGNNLHISLTTNNCLKLAGGDFVALLDHDDTLHPGALYLVAKELNRDKDLDFIYSDEDKLDKNGKHCDPYFKSGWNPDLLLSTNYICHLSVIRKSLMEKLGGMRKGYEGSQDYDLSLRITEVTQKIAHIPQVLYHWRKVQGSTSFSYQEKGYVDKASIKALRDAGERRKENWKVRKGFATCSFRVKRQINDKKKVAIIIPFRDKVELLKKCVESILKKTDYPNYELVLVDNESKEKETLEYLKKVLDPRVKPEDDNTSRVGSSQRPTVGSELNSEPEDSRNRGSLPRRQAGRFNLEPTPRVRVLKYSHPFNFSAINNWAVKQTDAPWVLFLNNDITAINRGWLSAMVEHVQRSEVGAVGAKLLYPNGKIQHAGVILGIGKFKDKSFGVAGHSHKYYPKGSHGYFEQIDLIRDYSAVTAACLLTRKDVFERVGGFDEKVFQVAWNDIDFCLRLRGKGYLVVYTPYAQLYHYESISRGLDTSGGKMERFHRECEIMYDRWSKVLARDPYYNSNLSLEDESFRIKSKIPNLNPLK